MNRRKFLTAAGAGAAISTLDWLSWFKRFGVPGTAKELGVAAAAAQAMTPEPRFLIYWFCEGGWDGYSMFNPVDTGNDATRAVPAGALRPSPGWGQHVYRPKGYGTAPLAPPKTKGNITYGYLAAKGLPLFNDMAVVSSHYGATFHSGARFDYHYGKYGRSMAAVRGPEERSVLQAFAEQYGASYLLPHVSWHKWLADGELALSQYPEGTGYADKLGPTYAHTIYGRTPAAMRQKLSTIKNLAGEPRDTRIRQFVDDMYGNFLKDRNGESVRAFDAAVKAYKSFVSGGGDLTPATMFTDAALRAEFGITAADELTSTRGINNQPARSKDSPNVNVQALMTYELMTKGLSVGFHIENRDVRRFDTHLKRKFIMAKGGQQNQNELVDNDVWKPLLALAARLKATPYKSSGKSYWDNTTIVLCSEMGRSIGGEIDNILASAKPDAVKYTEVMEQDCCSHWDVSSVAFLGGTVKGNTQFGRVGKETLDAIPILPNGSLDPAFDPVTGKLKAGSAKSAQSFVSNAGHVYATALHLSGIAPAGKGKNIEPPLTFVKK